MKTRKPMNIGLIVFLLLALIAVSVASFMASAEKSSLKEICELCEEYYDMDEVTTGDFADASFTSFNRRFRGRLNNGTIVIAEKTNGSWRIVELEEET